MALGPWEGAPKETIRENFPVEWELWLTNPERLRITGAERLADVQRRAFSNLEHLVHLHKGDTIAIVTHRAVLKPLLAAALGIAEPYFWRIHTDTASYSLLTTTFRGYCCPYSIKPDISRVYLRMGVSANASSMHPKSPVPRKPRLRPAVPFRGPWCFGSMLHS
jgi:broad specificity phosphatase PhoE